MSNPSFTAYIDESGELGMNFDRKSSEFLVMGAAIIPAWFPDCAEVFFDHARKLRGEKANRPIPKFQKASYKTQFMLSMLVARYPIAAVQVAFHKPSLFGSAMSRSPGKLYAYLIKLTLERVSWFVRSEQHPFDPNDGRCRIVFSENTALPYEDIKAYLQKLRREPYHNASIDWRYISAEEPEPVAHTEESETHLADIVASAMYWALDGTKRNHRYTDDRFLRLMCPAICGDQKSLYGAKFFPAKCLEILKERELSEFLHRLK